MVENNSGGNNKSFTCTLTGKMIYATNKAANVASISFRRRKRNADHSRGFGKKEPALQVFHCNHCGGFHLGHRVGKYRAKKRAKV